MFERQEEACEQATSVEEIFIPAFLRHPLSLSVCLCLCSHLRHALALALRIDCRADARPLAPCIATHLPHHSLGFCGSGGSRRPRSARGGRSGSGREKREWEGKSVPGVGGPSSHDSPALALSTHLVEAYLGPARGCREVLSKWPHCHCARDGATGRTAATQQSLAPPFRAFQCTITDYTLFIHFNFDWPSYFTARLQQKVSAKNHVSNSPLVF